MQISCIKFWQENPDYLLEVFTEYEDKSLMLMQRKQGIEETLDRISGQISEKEAELYV